MNTHYRKTRAAWRALAPGFALTVVSGCAGVLNMGAFLNGPSGSPATQISLGLPSTDYVQAFSCTGLSIEAPSSALKSDATLEVFRGDDSVSQSAFLYQDASCSVPLTTLTLSPLSEGSVIPPSVTTVAARFYLQAGEVGVIELMVHDTSGQLAPSKLLLSVGPPLPISIAASAGPSALVSGQCSAAFTVEARDSRGVAAAIATEAQTISLSADSENVSFYSDSACASPPVTKLDLDVGVTNGSFYARASGEGSYLIHADSPDLGEVSWSVTSTDPTFCFGSKLTATPYAGGDGSSGAPYKICTATQLLRLAATSADWGKSFLLMQDIALSSSSVFSGIGNSTTNFTGVFDGGGHTVSSVKLGASNLTDYVGFFGWANAPAVIKNLKLTLASAGGRNYVGGLAGNVSGSVVIDSCQVGGGAIVATGLYVGGLVGSLSDATVNLSSASVDVSATYDGVGGLIGSASSSPGITRSSATGNVTSSHASHCDHVGGLIGDSSFNTISESFATGNVTASGGVAGGFIGWNSGGTITNSYATGNVTSGMIGAYPGNGCGIVSVSSYSGGFVGVFFSGTITKSYSVGNVNVTGFDSGGFGMFYGGGNPVAQHVFSAGAVTDGGNPVPGRGEYDSGGFTTTAGGVTMTQVYWDVTRSGLTVGGGAAVGVNTAGAPNASYFFSSANAPLSSWDFTNVWTARANNYPILKWQGP